ncbi:hypothetical protein GWP85_07055 [Acinetobacter beijerinckii]|uniref:hypothetical protein n=1 Tax=Acinetobacter beijerinckii TaxID=262668 RepID=UPI0023DE09CA|nr:hypothetical protein [Acinetobacter beijerinckii]MDF2417276.1 hypothetical protein [Acinetobacter beijerinckii]
MSYEEKYSIEVNDTEKVIKFTRKLERSTCLHKHIEISRENDQVLCLDCKTSLNPVWWIADYLKHLNRVTERNNKMLSEAREIEKRLEKKNKFMCKHCYEVNTIDFKKLPSQAAVTRGISVIENEFDGMKVEQNQ